MRKAQFAVKAGEDYMIKLSKIAASTEEIAEKALHKAAGIVTDKVRENLKKNIADPTSAAKSGMAIFKKVGSKRTGDLSESLGITPMKLDRDGYFNVKIGFDGYDRDGVPNQLKARVMESGSSTIAPRPFVRPAVKATKKTAEEAMGRVIDEEIEKIMKG